MSLAMSDEMFEYTREQAKAPVEREKGPDPAMAEVIRRLSGRDDLDPWLAFPQGSCCFSFGEEGRPLPIGALQILWAAGWPWKVPCPACPEELHAIGFGGLLSVGGVISVYPSCDGNYFLQLGGLSTMGQLASRFLKGTEFHLKGGRFGGAFPSDGAELRSALGLDPPASDAARSEVSYHIVVPRPSPPKVP